MAVNERKDVHDERKEAPGVSARVPLGPSSLDFLHENLWMHEARFTRTGVTFKEKKPLRKETG